MKQMTSASLQVEINYEVSEECAWLLLFLCEHWVVIRMVFKFWFLKITEFSVNPMFSMKKM